MKNKHVTKGGASSQKHASKRQLGFTLLEVMVALSILAVAAAAIVQATSSSLRHAGHISDRQLAMWVAHNALETAMLPNQISNNSGESKFAGRDFWWRIKKDKTSVENFSKLTVTVTLSDNKDYVLATLIGYRDQS
ncbi:type II secretion system minor pseudopilin GspI [Neptuniibacter sp. QD72_48]|uniref:type II secretion system minor pseudopilin GspI n=1 Tax=unclassified Neptuniibacter TaxID=2630693 RepID=UPI0039F51E66